MSRQEIPKVGLSGSELRRVRPRELGLRFLFGAAISAVAGLVSARFGDRLGGLFLAFPAILPASLTLIEDKEGSGPASINAAGAAMGAAGLLPFALTAAWLLPRVPLAAALGAATAVWLLVAAGLYAVVAGWLRRHGLAGGGRQRGGSASPQAKM